MTLPRLGDPPDPGDLAILRAVMDASQDEATPTFGELPGFLFTLVCAPETVPPSEWLPEVFGAEPPFEDHEQAQSALSAVMALYNQINHGVLHREPRLPPGFAFEQPVLENFASGSSVGAWSRGFVRGHEWLTEDWLAHLSEEVEDELLASVFVLGFFHSRRSAQAVAGEEGLPLEVVAQAAHDAFVESMRSYAIVGRSIHEELAGSPVSEASVQQRPRVVPDAIGRNDPCPCGSGTKFKRCCGAAMH